jgi:hypothetical protein
LLLFTGLKGKAKKRLATRYWCHLCDAYYIHTRPFLV